MWVSHNLENVLTMERKNILNVQEFVYLGSKIIASGESFVGVQAQVYKSAGVFDRLRCI